MRFSARILPVVFGFIFFLLLLAPKGAAFASELPTIPTNPYLTPNTTSDVPKNLNTYTQSVFINTLATTICFLAGVDPISPNHKCLGFDPTSGKLGYAEGGGGAIGAMSGLISYTFIPPASSINYGKYLASNFGITQKAYAADDCTGKTRGYGFCSLGPLFNAWTAMRDIVYLLLVVIFVVIGVAIMLRVHIDPRTVMTIENQIPKIIVIILLVTFSMAIAGFLIDVMYVSIFVVGKVLTEIPGSIDISTYNTAVTAPSPWTALGGLSELGGAGGFIGISGAVATSFLNSVGLVPPGGILDIFGGPLGPFLPLVWIVLLLIVLLGLIYAMIRLWITLILAYITILLDVIFAPFWFLAGLIPGASIGTSGWFKDMLANLAVFPTTIAMFMLGLIFKNIAVGSGKLFGPPMLAGQNAEFFGGLILFGFIFMTPHALTTIKNAIKAPKLDLGPVLQPLGAAGKTIRAGASAGATYSTSTEKEMKETGFRRVIRRRFS